MLSISEKGTRFEAAGRSDVIQEIRAIIKMKYLKVLWDQDDLELPIEISCEIRGIGPNTMLSRWAINAQEVLIQGQINASAFSPVP